MSKHGRVVHVEQTAMFPVLAHGAGPLRAEVNNALVKAGISITEEDALVLAELRRESLAEVERVEFGSPAVVAIAKAIADSPNLLQHDAADTLGHLQRAFYALRNELPIDVPDAEIVDALRGCLDEWGDAAEVAAMPAEEVMSFSKEYERASESIGKTGYRIVDDEGRAYVYDPAGWGHDDSLAHDLSGWSYDETASGWDGERWADDWDD